MICFGKNLTLHLSCFHVYFALYSVSFFLAISNIFRSRETLEPTDFSCFLVDLSDKLDARTPGHVAIRAETEVAAAAADDKSVAGDKQANDLDRVDIS